MEECGRERVPQGIVVSDGCVLDERCLYLVDEVGLDCFGAPSQGEGRSDSELHISGRESFGCHTSDLVRGRPSEADELIIERGQRHVVHLLGSCTQDGKYLGISRTKVSPVEGHDWRRYRADQDVPILREQPPGQSNRYRAPFLAPLPERGYN